MSEKLNALVNSSLLGANIEFLEAQFETFQKDPSELPIAWQQYFEQLPYEHDAPEKLMSQVRKTFLEITRDNKSNGTHSDNRTSKTLSQQISVIQLIQAFRLRGHEHASIDPLKIRVKPEVREIDPALYGFTESDMDSIFDTASFFSIKQAMLKDIIGALQKTYCGNIGAEFMHILDTSEKEWVQRQLEAVQGKPSLSIERRKWILDRLTSAEGLEKYLHTKYTGQKRFSLEGGESLIVSLSALVQQAGGEINEAVLGMAHRGRLNVLVNVFGKKTADLFSEFEGKYDSTLLTGDVKYHQGFSSDMSTPNGPLHLALAFNPSHLEIVSPVVEGSVRARQQRRNDPDGSQVLPIVIHGDAAFAGQGVVMETFSMSEITGYSTQGTIHIVINNQIGFTTSNPKDARSTPYCTDAAKMLSIPIFHVNGDDPEAVYFVTQLAFEYRKKFRKDVVIDLVCYRRHGHNEADEPAATQPNMYRVIKKLPSTRKLYADYLTKQGIISSDQPNKMMLHYRNQLELGECIAPNVIEANQKINNQYAVDWSKFVDQDATEVSTSLPKALLQNLANKMCSYPSDIEPHARIAKIYADRKMMAADEKPADWGFAENLAYASLLHEGTPIRISGQDSRRGTFFHRHSTLHDVNNGKMYMPLQNMAKGQPDCTIIDSFLSEEAVLAFEFGFSTADPDILCIWEAQFGDFANGAQVVIDQFITSAEVKWGRLCGLVLFLPHGYEGQGPEHSSARPERFLQLCAQDNIQVVVPTTPAQTFHMIRRQMLRRMRRPLVVFTPKSLLRHPRAVNSLDELANGKFLTVIDDERSEITPKKVKRIVLCTGKIYYELLETSEKHNISNTAIVRIEQLYPFPYATVNDVLQSYPNAKEVVWCQEEPKNQGAWRSIRHRIERILSDRKLLYRGRDSSASPAVGYPNVHKEQQQYLIQSALGIVDWKEPFRPRLQSIHSKRS